MSEALRKLIAPYILRRTKEEVLADLPDLTAELVVCEPEEEQRKVYEEEQSRVRNYILSERENQGELRSDFMVLKALIRLRQIANHPRLVETGYEGNSGKFSEVFRMLGEVIASGHKVLVFSSFVKYLKMVAEETMVRGWKYAPCPSHTRPQTPHTVSRHRGNNLPAAHPSHQRASEAFRPHRRPGMPDLPDFFESRWSRLESHRGRLCIYSRSLVECRC